MTFKNQPKQVIKTTRKLFESRILPRIPAWFSAAEKYPNNTSYYRGPSSILPDPKDASITTTRQTILSSTTTSANVKGKGSSRKTKFVPPVPPKLVYPEDALRQRFFKDHPFELHRPISLVERKTVDDGWQAMINGDASRRVTVQDVIKYQLHLMSQGKTEDEAYAQATKILVHHRVYDEVQTERAKEQALYFGAKLEPSVTEKRNQLEEEILKKSKVIVKQKDEIRKAGEAPSEKSFKESASTESE